MRRTRLVSLISTLALALALALPASPASATGGGVFVGGCPLASLALTGTSGPINRLPGPMTLSLQINGSLCAVNLNGGASVTLIANLSSSSFGCFNGVATGTGTFSASDAGTVTGATVVLVNSGGAWTITITSLPTLSGVATGMSLPIACSLGTPAPQLTALGSLAFEDPELPG